MKRPVLAGIAIAVIVFITAVGSYQKLRDLDRSDSALYAYGGFLLDQGGWLYRDLWDHKPPGVYAIDALAFWLAGGPSWPAAVTVDTLATLLTVLACVVIVRRISSSAAAQAITAVTAAFYLNLAAFHDGGGLAEVYMVAFAAWAAWAFLAGHEASRHPVPLLLLSGVLAGLAILCKPTAMTTVAACLLMLTIDALRRRRLTVESDAWLRAAASYIAGAALPLVLAGLLFLWQGNLRDFIDASFLYNFSYLAKGGTLSKFWTLHLRHNLFLSAAAIMVLGALLLQRRSSASGTSLSPSSAADLDRFQPIWRIFLLIWLCFEWLGAYAGNYDNGSYMLPCVVPLACLAGPSTIYLARHARLSDCRRRRLASAACVVLLLLLAGLPMYDQWRQTLRIARRETDGLALDELQAADLIRASTAPTDRIWVWGYAPQVYLAAQRRPATRFVYDGAFLNSRRVMLPAFDQMLQELDRHPPVYIVDAATTGWFAIWLVGPLPDDLPPQAARYRTRLDLLRRWVTDHYTRTAMYGELIVYRHKGAGSCCGPGGKHSENWMEPRAMPKNFFLSALAKRPLPSARLVAIESAARFN